MTRQRGPRNRLLGRSPLVLAVLFTNFGCESGAPGTAGEGIDGGFADASPASDASPDDLAAPPQDLATDPTAADAGAGGELPPRLDADSSGVMPADVVAMLSGDRPIDAEGRLTNRATPDTKRRARAYLASVLAQLGLVPREHSFSSMSGPGVNLYVELPATVAAPEDAVIFGAHYDTVPGVPGAVDNATGTAFAFAIAQKLSALPVRRRPGIIAFFDIHETGTMEGSARFAEMILQRGTKVHSVHTMDQIGWDQDGDRGIEIEQPSEALEDLYRMAARSSGVPVAVTNAVSDHVQFRTRGFQAVGVTEQYRGGDTTPYYHMPGDRYPTVNLAYFESSLRVVLAVVETLF